MIKTDEEKFIEKYMENAKKRRVPKACTIEIITNCNFRCLHCYIPERTTKMNFEEFKKIIDEIKAAGCLFLTITGGEPLLHPEFEKMYTYAWKKGLSITIFSNGSLISDKYIKLFKDLRPKNIDITIYGASENTYEVVTKCRVYSKVLKNVRKLVNNKISVRLKMTILKENVKDFAEIEKISKKYSDYFRYDYMLMPKTDLDTDPLNHIISEDKILEFEEKEHTYETLNKMKNQSQRANKLFSCSAGITSFFIDSNGKVRLCNFATYPSYSLKKYRFLDIWNEFGIFVSKDLNNEHPCRDCKYKEFCTNCPVKTYCLLENKPLSIEPIPFYCEKAKKRYELFSKIESEKEKC